MIPTRAPSRCRPPFACVVALLLGLAALLTQAVLAEAWAAEPAGARRIVSLNLCTDQLLADLVTRDRIAAVSFLGPDATVSASAAKLAGLRTIRGSAEEALALDPDLVVAGQYSTPATVAMLERLGRRVVVVPLASDFAGIRSAIMTLAGAVGERARGEALVAELDRALAVVPPPAGRRPTAIAYQVNGLVSGSGSLVDAILRAAGFDNLAAGARLGAGGRLALESLVSAPPDLIVLAHGPDDFRSAVADNLRHPALSQALLLRPSMQLAMPYWLCGTPAVGEAVRRLAAMRARMSPPR